MSRFRSIAPAVGMVLVLAACTGQSPIAIARRISRRRIGAGPGIRRRPVGGGLG